VDHRGDARGSAIVSRVGRDVDRRSGDGLSDITVDITYHIGMALNGIKSDSAGSLIKINEENYMSKASQRVVFTFDDRSFESLKTITEQGH
jgi:hypothetical protein